jgi:hypothetical protein
MINLPIHILIKNEICIELIGLISPLEKVSFMKMPTDWNIGCLELFIELTFQLLELGQFRGTEDLYFCVFLLINHTKEAADLLAGERSGMGCSFIDQSTDLKPVDEVINPMVEGYMNRLTKKRGDYE